MQLALEWAFEDPLVRPMKVGETDEQEDRLLNKYLPVSAPPAKVKRSTSDSKNKLMCSICFEHFDSLADSCCGNKSHQCQQDVTMCNACSNAYWKQWIESKRFVIVPPQCLSCKGVVNFSAWSALVGTSLTSLYEQNMKETFHFRCPGCDEDFNFYQTLMDTFGKDEENENNQQQLRQLLIAQFTPVEGGDCVLDIERLMDQFLAYEINAKEFIEAVKGTDLFSTEKDDNALIGLFCPKDLAEGGDKWDIPEFEFNARLMRVLKLKTGNPERIMILFDSFLKAFPKVCTPCCKMEVCFSCKYESHHNDMTCKQAMQQAIEDDGVEDLFQCPECALVLQHAGGCTSIRCICGHEFSLDEDDYYLRSSS